jgi:hypothetical protein
VKNSTSGRCKQDAHCPTHTAPTHTRSHTHTHIASAPGRPITLPLFPCLPPCGFQPNAPTLTAYPTWDPTARSTNGRCTRSQ